MCTRRTNSPQLPPPPQKIIIIIIIRDSYLDMYTHVYFRWGGRCTLLPPPGPVLRADGRLAVLPSVRPFVRGPGCDRHVKDTLTHTRPCLQLLASVHSRSAGGRERIERCIATHPPTHPTEGGREGGNDRVGWGRWANRLAASRSPLLSGPHRLRRWLVGGKGGPSE